MVVNFNFYPKQGNNNQWTTRYALDFLKELSQEMKPNESIFNASYMATLGTYQKYEKVSSLYTMATSEVFSRNFTNDEKKRLGHDWNDIMFKCIFNNMDCTAEDFTWKFDRYYGNCYIFNSGLNASGDSVDVKESFVGGSMYGLQLQFYVGFHEELSIINSLYGRGG